MTSISPQSSTSSELSVVRESKLDDIKRMICWLENSNKGVPSRALSLDASEWMNMKSAVLSPAEVAMAFRPTKCPDPILEEAIAFIQPASWRGS